jgi:hypothetical protein
MISVWHLSALCCIPISNPKARLREEEIFCQVVTDEAKHAHPPPLEHRGGRWDGEESRKAEKST